MRVLSLFVVLVAALAVSVNGLGEGFGSELSNLDFGNIIGGPLLAVIDAQARSAATTMAFINTVRLLDQISKI